MHQRPKLGQHFLADSRFRRRIIEALELRPDDVVIEIGPGNGAMTELLAERAQHVVGIELDSVLASGLAQRLGVSRRIEIVCADILSTDLIQLRERFARRQFFVFGNLPYYISSPIIHRLFSYGACIRAMALLVQREVALRIAATPGSRSYGYLSVLAQLFSEPRVLFNIPPGAFSPPPKVYSALVNFKMRVGEGSALSQLGARASRPLEVGSALLKHGVPGQVAPPLQVDDSEKFLEFVKRCFAQKRRNVLNNLAGAYSRPRVDEALAALGFPSTIRAEQLSVEQLAHVYCKLGSADES